MEEESKSSDFEEPKINEKKINKKDIDVQQIEEKNERTTQN